MPVQFRGAMPGHVKNGGVSIPPTFDLRGDVVLTVLDGQSIGVFPSAAFDEMCEALEADDEMDLYYRAQYLHFRQHLGADGVLRIPERLLELAHLNGDVAILGRIDHLEILSAARFAAAMA